jgi:hypothetical protein
MPAPRGRGGREFEMTDATYNGWTNYETWAVGMFLDGNYTGPYDYFETIERVHKVYPTEESGRRYLVADVLKDWVEENIIPYMVDDDHPDPGYHPLAKDLVGAALSAVNWYELADAWINNVREQVTS